MTNCVFLRLENYVLILTNVCVNHGTIQTYDCEPQDYTADSRVSDVFTKTLLTYTCISAAFLCPAVAMLVLVM